MSSTAPLSDDTRDPLDLLAEQFLQRVRQGEAVTAESFAAAHPEHGAELRELLPTLLLLERAKKDRESTAGAGRRLSIPKLERLGDYRIVREVGRGGMGVVFEAVQESLGRRVALKVLPQASLLTGNQLERFLREAQIAARLHHTNIVPVFDSGEADGFHYYAMQFIDGRGLDAVVRELRAAAVPGSGALRDQCRLAARIGCAVASALDHAHAQGTLHRDVKPANLLLDDKEHVWVTDFGLAKALQQDGLTHSGDVLGTLQYMAPEQFAGQYDARSEVYALGATLYELIALQPAFSGATRSELIDKIRIGRCERLSRRRPEVPRDLETIVGRAMATEPRLRYATARELGDDLRAFLEDRPIAARRQSAAGRFVYWCRRNRALASAGAIAIAAVTTAAVIGWSSYWTTSDALQQVKASALAARQASERDQANLRDTLQAFEDVFDTLVGPDPLHALIDDEYDGSVDAALRAPLDAATLALLDRMLDFYDKFAARNADSVDLREQTARAYGRMGAIQARLGNLDDAVDAYEQAIKRLSQVTARDVTRDVAGLQQELGQVHVRRRQPVAAAVTFQSSLQLLEADKADTSRSSRRLQARAHYLLAQPFREGPPPIGGRRGPGLRGARGQRPQPPAGDPRPSGDPWRRLDEPWLRRTREHLDAAVALLEPMVAEQPDDAESQLLLARCLLARARVAEPADAATVPAARQRALDILGRLVASHDDVDAYRFELVEGMLALGRQAGAGQLESAVAQAKVLYDRRPDHPEYQAIYARCLSRQASTLRSSTPVAAGESQPGEALLQQALGLQRRLVDGRENPEPRFVGDLLASLRREAQLQLDRGDADGARTTAREWLRRWQDADRLRIAPEVLGGESGSPGDLFALFRRLGLADAAEQLLRGGPRDDRPREPPRRGR